MHKIIAIGGSYGSIKVLSTILAAFPADFAATVMIVSHIGARFSVLHETLAKVCALPVRQAIDGEPVLPGCVLLAPPDYHLMVSDDGARVQLQRGPKENHTRPAIDPLFRSVAAAYGKAAIGAVLTGYLDDGVAGLHAIKTCGGTAVVQDPTDAAAADMPMAALSTVKVDLCLSIDQLGPALVHLVNAGEAGAMEQAADRQAVIADAITTLRLENRLSAGQAGMPELARIASPSTFTCPDCHGTLWQLKGGGPKRFRCHTGHAYTFRALVATQGEAVEDALWAALRALQEKEKMLWDLHMGTADQQVAEQYAEQATFVSEQLAVLRRMLTS